MGKHVGTRYRRCKLCGYSIEVKSLDRHLMIHKEDRRIREIMNKLYEIIDDCFEPAKIKESEKS